ncbi:hypothetical protein GCM10010174_80860 [Kutzneria viridogrisea]|uniref:Uncharacterized protein n=1 Tax=Kutzneria viridogrisea TaxID=47990 RepID=A0ABR6BZL8_9PSEU|nr:hypothetical protein [Kutzneria viridogrisea]
MRDVMAALRELHLVHQKTDLKDAAVGALDLTRSELAEILGVLAQAASVVSTVGEALTDAVEEMGRGEATNNLEEALGAADALIGELERVADDVRPRRTAA